jgi:hypothetical protein
MIFHPIPLTPGALAVSDVSASALLVRNAPIEHRWSRPAFTSTLS